MNDYHPSSPDINHLVTSAFLVLEQSPPPSLCKILVAYRSKADGDRDMLLAIGKSC
ncbi:hypothetical protein L208DRAFT_1465013 [Tricholoma matsutake]|nr:hypothetical protein L208DRAFT_1465013 [Tricholoma matsutake 945]